MTQRAYIRTTRVNGKTQDSRDIIIDSIKVAELSRLDLIDLIAQAILSLKEDNG